MARVTKLPRQGKFCYCLMTKCPSVANSLGVAPNSYIAIHIPGEVPLLQNLLQSGAIGSVGSRIEKDEYHFLNGSGLLLEK